MLPTPAMNPSRPQLSRYGCRPVDPPGGVEVRISVLHEQVAGLLVLFGPGGADGDVLADRAARLAPLTDADADT